MVTLDVNMPVNRCSRCRATSDLHLPSDEAEGGAEAVQHVYVQVETAEGEKDAERREADEEPENLTAEVERSQAAERERSQGRIEQY